MKRIFMAVIFALCTVPARADEKQTAKIARVAFVAPQGKPSRSNPPHGGQRGQTSEPSDRVKDYACRRYEQCDH
jgi:hypothetical protein